MTTPEWSRQTNDTLKDFIRGSVPALMRSQKWLALTEKLGRVMYNQSANSRNWKVDYNRAAVEGNLGNTAIDFESVDRFQMADLGFRGFLAKDQMSKREKVANKGREAIINYFKEMGPRLIKDLKRSLGVIPWTIDGNAAANVELPHGFPSFLGSAGNSVTITSTSNSALRSYNQADPTVAPSDSYADLNTDLGSYTGSWTGAWPNSGSGDDSFDFWSPILVNYQSTFFGSTNTWASQCTDAMRFLITAAGKDSSADGTLDLIELDRELFRQFKTKNDQYSKIEITPNTPLRAMGFLDTILLDGVEVTSDFGIPSNIGYGLNIKQTSLRSWQEELFDLEGPTWNQQARTWRTVADFLGNIFVETPKYFGQLKNYHDTSGL